MRRLLLLLLFFFLLLFAVHRLFLLFLLLLVVLCSVIVDCTWSPLFLFSFFAAVVFIAKRVMVSVSVISGIGVFFLFAYITRDLR